jgi:hypothetical protein
MNPENDLVFYKDKNGAYMSGGYKIQSQLFENTLNDNNNHKTNDLLDALINSNEMSSLNSKSGFSNTNQQQQGGSTMLFSHTFKDLIVPAGLLYLQHDYKQGSNTSLSNIVKNTENMIYDNTLYDKLVGLVTPSKRINHNIKSRKMKIKIKNTKPKPSKNKTRKMK